MLFEQENTTINYSISLKQINIFYWNYYLHHFSKNLWKWCLISLFCGIILSNSFLDLTIILLYSIFIFLLVFITTAVLPHIKTYYKSSNSFTLSQTNTFWFTFSYNSENIHFSVNDKQHIYKWESVKSNFLFKNYYCLEIMGKGIIIVPVSLINSYDIFINTNNLSTSKVTEKEALKIPKTTHIILFIVSIVPVFGVIPALIILFKGLNKYHSKLLTMLGLIGIFLSFSSYFLLIHNLTNPGYVRSQISIITKYELNELVKDIEIYKLQTGHYPESLNDLLAKNKRARIFDPLQSAGKFTKKIQFEYEYSKDQYKVYSKGVDGIGHNSDDIYPDIKVGRE